MGNGLRPLDMPPSVGTPSPNSPESPAILKRGKLFAFDPGHDGMVRPAEFKNLSILTTPAPRPSLEGLVAECLASVAAITAKHAAEAAYKRGVACGAWAGFLIGAGVVLLAWWASNG